VRVSVNVGLVMVFSHEVIQRVTRLNLDIHRAAGILVVPHAAEKLMRRRDHLDASRRGFVVADQDDPEAADVKGRVGKAGPSSSNG
jgi:hypothetical protein